MNRIILHHKSFFKKSLFVILFLSLFVNLFSAENTKQDFNLWGSGEIFKVDKTVDSAIFTTYIPLFLSQLIINNTIKPQKSGKEYYSATFDRNEVNFLDKGLMFSYSKTFDLIGTGFEALSLLTPAFLLITPTEEWATIALMYSETILYAYGFKELGKGLVDRARPYMYFDEKPENKLTDGDWNCSFFSGHSTLAFAAATFTTYVFCKYDLGGYWTAPVIISTYAIATLTAVSRILSGNHFLTDVLTGAVVGSATGFLIPFIHSFIADKTSVTFSKGKKAELSFIPNGIDFRLSF